LIRRRSTPNADPALGLNRYPIEVVPPQQIPIETASSAGARIDRSGFHRPSAAARAGIPAHSESDRSLIRASFDAAIRSPSLIPAEVPASTISGVGSSDRRDRAIFPD